ncbi:MAG: pyridoxamine 5'-phosphate oxidase family protein [Caldimonas sp.]
MTDKTENRKLLWEMIKDTRFGMFTTRHGNGHLHSRPMTTQNSKLDQDDSLWFFMSRKGDSVADLEADPTVNVAYANQSRDSYVSVSGAAKVVDDLAKKKQLWNKMTEAWFPNGPTDPDLALVQVLITHANYWDVEKSKVVQLYEMAKAFATGKPPIDMARHGEVRMK